MQDVQLLGSVISLLSLRDIPGVRAVGYGWVVEMWLIVVSIHTAYTLGFEFVHSVIELLHVHICTQLSFGYSSTVSSSRLEEQRTTLPRGEPSATGALRREFGQMSAPTVPDEDFFSMITKLQSNRLDEQRYEFRPDKDSKTGATSAASTSATRSSKTTHTKTTSSTSNKSSDKKKRNRLLLASQASFNQSDWRSIALS
ncbi:hypothetical protein EB796_004507 [Bugula neritina]|uniref:Uncharacterized protein n=1 Tax=Bugula neritina TaxID=10212 RepID=A0A7J7KG59_BUGNE|nr:hypothetical protein EB796_004507 [Bugula neritina]